MQRIEIDDPACHQVRREARDVLAHHRQPLGLGQIDRGRVVVGDDLLDLTQRFERIWYGNRPVADDDASRVTAHLEELGCLRPGERVI